MITQNSYHAAYAKIKGVKLGVISMSPNGSADIELKIAEDEYADLIDEYNRGDKVDVRTFTSELRFITNIIRCRKRA